MPLECECRICGQIIWFVGYSDAGESLWQHYGQPGAWHDAEPPEEIRKTFTRQKKEPEGTN
jgi:hypothetical protein